MQGDSPKILDFDHVELAVADLDRAAGPLLQMGFEKTATREIRERQLRSYLLTQNNVAILLSHSTLRTDPAFQFVESHGDGVIGIGFRCEDAVSALEVAVQRGAVVAEPPKSFKRDFGTVQQATIQGAGDVRHTFVSRQGGHFLEGFDVAVKPHHRGCGLERVSQVGWVVEKEKFAEWVGFHERTLGLKPEASKHVLQSANGAVRMTFLQPEESPSAKEFFEISHGSGVQYLSLETEALADTTRSLLKEGIKLRSSDPEDSFPRHGLTSALIGPFFFELIERSR